jgi:hypothetical protein
MKALTPSVSPVTRRQLAWFRLFRDLFAPRRRVTANDILDTQREAAPDVDPEAELCGDCGWYPATIRGRCFSCESTRRMRA